MGCLRDFLGGDDSCFCCMQCYALRRPACRLLVRWIKTGQPVDAIIRKYAAEAARDTTPRTYFDE